MRYRKLPVVIDAVQILPENENEIFNFMMEFNCPFEITGKWEFIIHTLEGDMLCSTGDYLIRGVNGEFYPCKPDIFEKTYEKVNVNEQQS